MNPLNAIEKWINEHGSAAILRDHVALLKDEITTRDQKIASLETEKINLEKLNGELKKENDNFRNQAKIAKAAERRFPQPGLIHDFDRQRRRRVP